jgi:hypothetical protein
MADEYDPYDEHEGDEVPEGLPCVELEFATLRRFREEMAPYLNYDGFFARTENPLPRGTTVEFKFVMPEEFVLARGTAVVSWTIEPEGNPDLVPGMALRFGKVGQQSRAVIDELVDFHVATGGDPFDVGPRPGQAGDIPTDSLGAYGGGASSTIDSPPPTPRELPLQAEPEVEPTVEVETADDGVLPDWLSDPEGGDFSASKPAADQPGAESGNLLDFGDGSIDNRDDSEDSHDLDLSVGSRDDDLDVAGIFDTGDKVRSPSRPAEGSFQQMAMSPRPGDKPPRDIRLGILVAAGMVVIAIVVLAVTLWVKSSDWEVAETEIEPEVKTGAGVELIEDDLDEVTGDNGPEETAGMVAPQAVEAPGDLPEESAAAPEKALVAEPPPGAMASPVVQPRASRVVDVVAAARADTTSVVVRGNGAFDASGIRTLRLEDPVRLWVSISPIETFYRPNEIQVGSDEVDRVRIGFHPEDSPPALYVVLDLAGDDVVLLDTSVQGDAIRLTVGRE